MRPIAFNHIFQLSNELTNPERATWLMRDYMKKAIKLSKNTVNKDTILLFNKSRVGHKDVEDIAESLVYKMKNSDKSRETKYHIVKDLMKYRLRDAIKSTESAKKELNISKDNLTIIVRKGTLVRQEFMDLVEPCLERSKS